jgi:RimJ/RimL family protein N-acetyltransferase
VSAPGGLSGFGISLVRLSLDDIEMVRLWRNDEEIRQFMVFRDYISPEQQKRWYESVENPLNHYSLIVYQGEKVGLTHVKNVDLRSRSAEGGMFIYRKDLRNSVFGYRAAIVGSDWCFYELGLTVITGTVLKENRRAIRFNLGLGHTFDPEVPGSAVLTCRLTREAYERVRPGLIAAIK